MTPEESKELKPGMQVIWENDQNDTGEVIEVTENGVSIQWLAWLGPKDATWIDHKDMQCVSKAI